MVLGSLGVLLHQLVEAKERRRSRASLTSSPGRSCRPLPFDDQRHDKIAVICHLCGELLPIEKTVTLW